MKQHSTQLLKEWCSKNEKPLTDYTPMSHFKGWWQCITCQHQWQSTIENRQRGSKCPNCRKLNQRGSKNHAWTGYGEISGRQWHCIQYEASKQRRNRRYTVARPPLEFTITIEYIWDLFLKQDRKCALSGEPLTMWHKVDGKIVGNASLDRIDSSKGYTKENVQWIDKKLQHVKTKLSDAEFIAICQKVAAHQIEKLGIPSFKKWTKTKTVS